MKNTEPHSCWPLRSLLFTPAHRIEWVRKLAKSSTDGVILDLEDAVPPAKKPEARRLMGEEIDLLAAHGIAPIVRVNALGSGCETDVAACVRRGLAGVMLPKTDSADDIRALDKMLGQAERVAGVEVGTTGIIALPETAKGMWFAYDIASASPRVSGLITGVTGPVAGDVARAAGFQPTIGGEEQLFLQSHTILASRAAGAMYPIGTIIGTALNDLVLVEKLARRARQLGFSGVALIHPGHVAIANKVFCPTPEEVEYAQGLIAAMESAEANGEGAVSYQGAMVDAAMVPPARETIAAAARFQSRDRRGS